MVYFISFIVTGLIWLLGILTSRIFPFGVGTIFTSDMAYQYVGYFEYIRRILLEDADIFFSFYKGMGEESMGMLSYYMMSPFNLLVSLFPKENISEAVLVINLLKICTCGLTFSVFLNKKFKGYTNNAFAVVAFSVCYALMAYNIAYQFNIMWLDGVIWLPIIILGIDRIIKKNKSELFYISLTITLISNWYIGFMLCVFSGLYIIYSLIASENEKINRLALKKFALFGVMAAGTALVVIFPAVYTCLNEVGRGNLFTDSTINYTLLDILSKFVIGGISFSQITDNNYSSEYLNLPNLFAGTVVLLLFVIYFFNKSVSKKERKLDGVFGIVLLIMTLIMPLNRIWHVFTYNVWFPYRYSFCLTFYMIYIAYKSLLNIKEFELKRVWKIFFIIVGIYFIIEKLSYTYIVSELIYCTVFMMFAGLIAIKLIKNNEKSAYLLLAVVMCSEMFVNTALYLQHFSYNDRNVFYADRVNLSNKLDEINDNGYYRVENDIVKDGNTSMGYKYLGISSSSTMGKENSRGLMESLGYTRVANNKVKYKATTKFADNFLGIKYFISDDVIRNDDALSLGFLVDKTVLNIAEFTTKWGEHSNSFEKQNELVTAITGIENKLYKEINIFDKNTENLEEIEIGKYNKIYSGSKALYSFYFNTPNENEIYLKSNGGTVDRAKLYVNGEENSEYMMIENYSVINIGKFKEGEKIKVDIEFVNADDVIVLNDVWVYYEDIDVYDLVMEKLKENQLNIKNIEDNKLVGEIEVVEDNRLLLFSIPYDKYLKVYVDNSPVKTMCTLDSLISVPLEKGNHTIMVKYEPEYFPKVVVISGIFVLIAIVNIFNEYKKKKD